MLRYAYLSLIYIHICTYKHVTVSSYFSSSLMIIDRKPSLDVIPITSQHLEYVYPRDLSSIGCVNDLRVPENLFNHVNNLTDDRFMWLIPYTKDSSHQIQLNLKSQVNIVGFVIWNYNKGESHVYICMCVYVCVSS